MLIYAAILLVSLAHAAEAEDVLQDFDGDLNSLSYLEPDPEEMYKVGDEASLIQKRFLPWYMFKYEGKPIKPEDLRKSQKRAPLKLVTFPCFRKFDAVCENGGRGPKILRKGKGGVAMCACMCPYGFTEPKCGKNWWIN